jgi:type I restriction enzyme S subunit
MGWNLNKLSRIADIGAGNSAPQKKELFEGGIHSFIRTSDVGLVKFGVISDSRDKLNNDGIKKLRKVLAGSVLVPKSGASTFLNHRVLLSKDSYVSSHLATIKANQRYLEDGFLLYFLLTIKAQDLVQDHDYPSLRLSDLANIEVPTPSVPEQKRIVAILDQAFADIEQARAKTEQNLKNARELFESYLQQVFSQRGEGWEIKKITEIAETCLGKMLDKKKNKGNLKPYLRNQNVQWFDISTADLLEMRFEDSEYERYAVKKGDLVICEGGYPGRGAVWEKDEDIFFQKALHRIRCHNPLYNRWVLYYLYLSDCNGTLKNSFTGAGIQHFTGKSLKQLALPIPPVELTEKFVCNFDELFNHIISLEHVYHNKLNSIDELKKSILQKAFSGELTKEKEGAVA